MTPLQVLLVEDSEDDALLLQLELRRGGYEATLFRVDTEAGLLNALKETGWDVIITDHNLPGLDSLLVLQIILATDLDIPVIIVSGSIGEEVAVKAMKAGANDYIMKNNMARLSPAIERELRDAKIRHQKREADKTIRHMAFYDPLTQLPNRRLLIDRLEHALLSSFRNKHHGAVLYLDMDNFKNLNDTKGHAYGDALLVVVAERLKSCMREQDTVARLGGDEFLVMLENLGQNIDQAAVEAKSVGDKIISLLHQPSSLNGHEYYPSCSIGIALFHGKQSQLEDLLTQADTSMYEAKKAGRNTLRFFDPSMQKTLEKRVELEYALRKAVKSDQFQLYYQLQVDSENQPLGVEALIRWFHPEKGIISPSEFIPLAEEIHLIDDIGQWVLEVVCSQIIAWQTSDIFKSLTVSVNVSPMQFMQAHFVDNVKNTVEKYCVDPTRIKLELTETMVLANIEDSIVKMNQLKALGFAISLDDFGTGYSSLSYLKRLPFDQIKIDRSFIISATTNEKDAFLVQFVICMGEKFAMHVIAEGIETEEQFTFLENLNCNAFQGYLFGKPMPVADLEAQLRASVAR